MSEWISVGEEPTFELSYSDSDGPGRDGDCPSEENKVDETRLIEEEVETLSCDGGTAVAPEALDERSGCDIKDTACFKFDPEDDEDEEDEEDEETENGEDDNACDGENILLTTRYVLRLGSGDNGDLQGEDLLRTGIGLELTKMGWTDRGSSFSKNVPCRFCASSSHKLILDLDKTAGSSNYTLVMYFFTENSFNPVPKSTSCLDANKKEVDVNEVCSIASSAENPVVCPVLCGRESVVERQGLLHRSLHDNLQGTELLRGVTKLLDDDYALRAPELAEVLVAAMESARGELETRVKTLLEDRSSFSRAKEEVTREATLHCYVMIVVKCYIAMTCAIHLVDIFSSDRVSVDLPRILIILSGVLYLCYTGKTRTWTPQRIRCALLLLVTCFLTSFYLNCCEASMHALSRERLDVYQGRINELESVMHTASLADEQRSFSDQTLAQLERMSKQLDRLRAKSADEQNMIQVLKEYFTESLIICGWWCEDLRKQMVEANGWYFQEPHNEKPFIVFLQTEPAQVE
mmetsp:Transcript_10238/g.16732  ORF Transcript_10238/g.16732 Transcript_10238/m.16732 type:complete len:520 (-) Transcript_10238:1197-2756(-)